MTNPNHNIAAHIARTVCAMVIAVSASMSVASAAKSADVIDLSSASNGYACVHYSSDKRLKVGVACDGRGRYYMDCTSGHSDIPLTYGNGVYTVTLYQNINKTTYRIVERHTVNVTMTDSNAPYKVSTVEAPFTAGDTVCKQASALCKTVKTDEQKVVAIYNYLDGGGFTYDHQLANSVAAGKVKNYLPSPTNTLATKKGICYDYASLFATMCRSQGVVCKIVKGYTSNGVYHAWNKVCIKNKWYPIDITYAIGTSTPKATNIAGCVSHEKYTV